MKINRFAWEPDFLLESSVSSIYCYDFLVHSSYTQPLRLSDWQAKFAVQIDANRPREVFDTIGYIDLLALARQRAILSSRSASNGHGNSKQKETKFKINARWRTVNPSFFYVYFFYLAHTLKEKNISFSRKITPSGYCTTLNNLNNGLKIGSSFFNDTDPNFQTMIGFKNNTIGNRLLLSSLINNL